jgi:hypothetical protein
VTCYSIEQEQKQLKAAANNPHSCFRETILILRHYISLRYSSHQIDSPSCVHRAGPRTATELRGRRRRPRALGGRRRRGMGCGAGRGGGTRTPARRGPGAPPAPARPAAPRAPRTAPPPLPPPPRRRRTPERGPSSSRSLLTRRAASATGGSRSRRRGRDHGGSAASWFALEEWISDGGRTIEESCRFLSAIERGEEVGGDGAAIYSAWAWLLSVEGTGVRTASGTTPAPFRFLYYTHSTYYFFCF